MKFEDYRNHPAISNSDLSLINRSVEHFEYAKENPKKSSASQKFGSAFHAYVLEPDVFKSEYIILPEDIKPGSSKAYKEFKEDAEAKGLTILTVDDLADIKAMAKRVAATKFLRDGVAEKELFGEIVVSGQKIPVKCRPDYRLPSMIFDLKSTESAQKDKFIKSIIDYRYYVQGALYLEIARQNYPLIENFVFIAVESSAPYGIACYEMDAAFIEAGKMQYMADLQKYLNDKDSPKRKGYEGGVNIISPPAWFANKYFNKESK